MPETLERPSYEEDFYAWALDQAERLRAQAALRPNEPLDWENLAEEIEGLARSDWRACASLLEQILAHLSKLAFSTAQEPRAHWRKEVMTLRLDLEDLLTPALRRALEADLDRRWARAVRRLEIASRDVEPALAARLPASCPWSFEQVVGDFFPEPASAAD
ncbi:MAG: DUF29 domain-containing protein [Geminicoccaceae bacterium]|nr:DUF29 domain-containing protein [Geminicoccaceae bacterium]